MVFLACGTMWTLWWTRPARERMRERAQRASINEAAGAIVGRALMSEIAPDREIVVLFEPAATQAAQAALDAQIAGILRALGPAANRLIRERLRSVPMSGDAMTDEEWEQTDSSASRILMSHPKAGAVVLMTGTPEVDAQSLPRHAPPVYVLNTVDNSALRSLLSRGRIRGAVVYAPDFDPNARPGKGMSVDEVFALRFRYLSAP